MTQLLLEIAVGWDIPIFFSEYSDSHTPLPLYIKDEATTRLVGELARKRGLTKQKAVRLAVEAELERAERAIPLRERLARLWEAHPLPPSTGQVADKPFYDELSGEP